MSSGSLATAIPMPRATPSSDTIPFIVTTPARQSVEEKRKLIRSHVMRGKNRKKPRSMPPSWTSSAHPNLSVSRRKDYTLSIPVKVGGGFSFPASSVELPPDVLESIWKRKQYRCSATAVGRIWVLWLTA